MSMFRRKEAAHIEGEICPYCEFVNDLGATTCIQCYYELNKAPRDQGEQVSIEVSDSIFDELMSDDDDSWIEGDALDVVLSLDQGPQEVEQYTATDFHAEEPEKIDYFESSKPELQDTVSHKPDEITVEDMGDVISNVEKLDFSKEDPFAEVAEPVHQGKGALFSPSTPSKLDDDLLGHVGGSELPSLPSDDEIYESKIDFTVRKAPSPTPAVVLPPNPVIKSPDVEPSPEPIQNYAPEPIPEFAPQAESFTPAVVEAQVSETEYEIPESIVESIPKVVPIILPEPMVEPRIWPWAASETWDARIVHREVVSALEQVKSGHIDEATTTIDTLGPHLSDENIDLIYHIGMVLKQINRVEEVKTMLEKAKLAMPDNEHVSSAVAHLGI